MERCRRQVYRSITGGEEMGSRHTAESEARKAAIDVLQAGNYIHRREYPHAAKNIAHAITRLEALVEMIKAGR